MNDNKRKGIRNLVLLNLGLLCVFAAFLLYALTLKRITVPYVYCLMYSLFHLYCPFCGGTRAIFDILNLDMLSAIKHNVFLIYLIIAFVFYDIRALSMILKGQKNAFSVPKWLWMLTVILFAVFFVVRNLLMIAFGIDTVGDLAGFWR